MVPVSRKVAIAACMLAVVSIIVSCRGRTSPRLQSRTRSVTRWDEQSDKVALSVAEKYITAWVSKDYCAMWRLQCNKSFDYRHGDYAAFKRLVRTWREEGMRKTENVKIIPSSEEICSSIAIIQGVTRRQAKLLLLLAVDDASTLDQLEKDRWPDRWIFLRHRIGSRDYILMLVRDAGKWSVMNQPGTLELPPGM